jgi:hypothetical protein
VDQPLQQSPLAPIHLAPVPIPPASVAPLEGTTANPPADAQPATDPSPATEAPPVNEAPPATDAVDAAAIDPATTIDSATAVAAPPTVTPDSTSDATADAAALAETDVVPETDAVPEADAVADTHTEDSDAVPETDADAPPELDGAVDGADSGFAPGVSARLKNYVYLLVDPRTGRAFYAGRGRNDRCFRHVRAARAGSDPGPDAVTGEVPKYPMLEKIREVESGGRPVRIDILRHGLSAEEALLVEAAAHDALGLAGVPQLGSQRHSTEEVSSLLAKRAKFKRSHQVVLLRVGARGTDGSYESARHGWRIGKRWIDTDSPRSPQWAVIVVGELVTGVHRIDRWEPAPIRGRSRHAASASVARSTYRYSFAGPADPEMEERYVGKSVAAYLGGGVPSPVTYVWCGPHWVNSPR